MPLLSDPHLAPYKLEPTANVVVTTALVHALRDDHTAGWIEREILRLLDRHFRGDWGTLCAEDAQMNEAALTDGSRILSRYEIDDTAVYVITDAGHEVTTVMRPEDY